MSTFPEGIGHLSATYQQLPKERLQGTVNLSEIWAEKRDPHDGK